MEKRHEFLCGYAFRRVENVCEVHSRSPTDGMSRLQKTIFDAQCFWVKHFEFPVTFALILLIIQLSSALAGTLIHRGI